MAQIKSFLHACKKCSTKYRLSIDLSSWTIQRAKCPSCGHTSAFDNRSGELSQRFGAYKRSSGPQRPSLKTQPVSTAQKTGSFTPPRAAASNRVNARDALRSTPVSGSFRSRKPARSGSERSGFTDFFSNFSFSLPGFSGLSAGGHKRKWIIAAAGLLFIFGFIYFIFAVSVDGDHYFQNLKEIRANRIVDKNGELIAELFARKTGSIQKNKIPEKLKETLLFVEDRNFYSHGGIHFPSIIRALFKNIFSMGYAQGGSTLTQQLARIILNDRDKTIYRKLKEASLAYQLEWEYDKDEILAYYMNHVYLGHGATGMDVAAKFYFDKAVTDLNFSERLILSSLPAAPARYSPIRNPNKLSGRMDAIYNEMESEGFPVPSREEYQNQKREVLTSLNRSPSASVFGSRKNDAPHVAEYVRIQIEEHLGKDYMFGAGLTIETTIDRKLQAAAVKHSNSFIDEVRKYHPGKLSTANKDPKDQYRKTIKDYYRSLGAGPVLLGGPSVASDKLVRLQTASIGLNPKTGEILFMQGGADFQSNNQLNRALYMKRQTGSSIKPIIYAAAIENGLLTPASPVDDSPLFFGNQSSQAKGYWLPDNISGVYEGNVPVRTALAKSLNVPAIRVGGIVGLERLAVQFKKFFFHTDSEFKKRFREDQTIAIGTLEMSPLEMAMAYSVFANNGKMSRPYLIKRIVSEDGEVLFEGTGKDEFNTGIEPQKQVVPGDVAQVMISLLKDASKYGGVARSGFRDSKLAGKTGTTNEHRDAWFIGTLPELTAAVWVGFDDPAYATSRGTGASLAGPLFARILSSGQASRYSKSNYEFSPNAVSATVCPDSGLLPTKYCPKRKTEIFARASVPDRPCDVHEKPELLEPETRDTDFE